MMKVSGGLSGRDKAKALKMMREQQKQQGESSSTKHSSSNHAIGAGSAGKLVGKPQMMKQSQAELPPGFFDDSVSIPNSVQSAQTNNSTTAGSGIGNLPAGFFDNPVEDLNARGITMEQYTAKMEKEEREELDSFLTEIKGS